MSKIAVFILISLYINAPKAEVTSSPCPNIQLSSPENIEFTPTERRLLCGDPDSQAYGNIPLFQAEFHLRSFLESRAYLEPSFSIQDQTLTGKSNQRHRLNNLVVLGVNDERLKGQLEDHLRRFYRQELVRPALLDQIEASVQNYLADQGYACLEVQSSYQVPEQLLQVSLNNLKEAVFGQIDQDPIEGFLPEIISRTRPFEPHHPYRQFYLDLHEKRLLRSGVVQGSFYRRQCQDERPTLRHSFVLGPPRVLRFGAGFNSEVGPLLRARWTHQRLGPKANRLDGMIETSLKQQKISGSLKNYHFTKSPRTFALYRIDLLRDDFKLYEEISATLRPHLGFNWDSRRAFNELLFGPNATTSSFKIAKEPRSLSETSGALELNFRRTTHLYEDAQIHPHRGSELLINAEYRHPNLGFQQELYRIETSYVSLHPVATWGRGDLILGQKIILGTTYINHTQFTEDLPPSLKFYAGGSHDIRGHGLNDLPNNNGTGALTKMALRLEARKTAFFRDDLEFALFFDAARLSEQSFSSKGETPYSPGLALRWNSPIGMIQTYAARTLFARPHQDDGMLYFIGLGGGL
jgi:translocation and assembly module TamA